jgi:hypothetical protein
VLDRGRRLTRRRRIAFQTQTTQSVAGDIVMEAGFSKRSHDNHVGGMLSPRGGVKYTARVLHSTASSGLQLEMTPFTSPVGGIHRRGRVFKVGTKLL